MNENDRLAEQFEAHRNRLRSIAYRMLGSLTDADDAVQESWLRLNRTGGSGVDNLGGWLTAVVAHVCLDMLRSRKSRREDSLEDADATEVIATEGVSDPEREALLADSIGVALLVVLERLTPAERVAFVLHDMFDLPFEEIAPIVGRSPTAARQLASRARRRVQGAGTTARTDRTRKQEIVGAFLAAAREGNFAGLIAMLDPDVVLRSDFAAVQASAAKAAEGAPKLEPEVRGADIVAKTFSGRARAAQPALVDGVPGLAWAPGGVPRVVFGFTIAGGKIVEINLIADPERIGRMDVVILGE
jgi:RNA polymerase sigma-70 factor (ECF subfamily)